ncbi:hypothetical protein FQR65_LT09018 [Abscondita terminalis]|nr:hypothetical protein FQR65_LT09018 [Abscondita terminalis]
MNTVDGCNEGVSTKTAGRNLCESFNKLHVRRTSKSCYYEDNLLVQTKLFLLQNDEVDPAIPSKFQDLVQRLKKFLQDVPKHIRRSKQCVEDFYRMLLFLQDYLSRYIEVFKQYPLTQDLTSLLVEYVELEYEVLYLGNCYSPEYQKQVENRLLTYLLMFLYGSTVKKGTNIVDGSAINALYIIKNVRPDYKREHDLIENLTRKLLTKLNVLDAVNEIRKQDIDLVNAEKFFQAPRLQEISKQLQNIASIIDSPESDDEIQEIDIPRPMLVKSEPTEAKVDLSKYPCFNLEENLRSESDDRHVHSNNSDKCKYEHYNCSTSSFSDEPINISDDDNSDVEFTEEAPVSVIDLEDGVEKIGAGVSVPSQNDAFVSDFNANTTTSIPFGSDSTKAQTQNLRKRDDVIINESVQIQEKDDASFNAHLEQNLNNQKCGVKKNNVVYVSDDEDNEIEIVQLLPVVVDQKSNSVESIKLLHNNKESENVITVVQDQNKCLDDNVFASEIHCAVNDIQTAEKPQVGEIISEESTKDSGTAVESLNDFILDIDISNSLNINSTQSKSTTVFEDDETNISKSIINQLEYAIQCSGTFRSNGIGNNVDNVVSKQLPYDLVQEEIVINEAVVIQGETVAVLTANEVIAEQTDLTSTVQEEAIDSISLITTEVSEEVVEGLTSSAQPEHQNLDEIIKKQKVDLSKYPCFNLEENLRSESDDRHVHSNNSDKCKYEHYNCSTSSFSDEPINISDDDNSDVEFTEEAPVSVIDLEDGVEKIGAGVSVPSQNDAFVSDVNANTTTSIPFGSDSTKAQTQNLRKRDDVIINESVQIQEKDDASFNAHLEQNLNNQKCGVKKNNVVYVSDDEDNEVEIVQLLPVVVDQKSNSVESIKLLHNNKESENVITVVQDQNKCLDDNVFDREIHCAVNDIQTAEKPQVGEIISEESTKDSGTAVESLNDFILDIDISNSLNINSTQSKSTTVFEDDETNISKSIINQLEYAIQCSGTFRSNGIGNNVDNVVSKQLPYDLVQEEIVINEAVVIQGETVAVLTANEVIAEQTDLTSTVQEEAIDSISLITTEVSEEVVEGLTSSAQPENEIIIQQVEDTTEKSVKLVEITTNKISEEQVDEPTLTSGSVSVEKEIIVRSVDDATIELTTQPEHQNLDEIIVVDNTTLLQEKEVESNSIRTIEISQEQTDGSTVEQEETIDSIPLTAVAVEEVIVGPINNATIESAVQPENENLEEIIAAQARHATILPGKAVEQTDGLTLGKEETVDPIPLTAVEVEEEVILGQLNDATIESSVQPENENSEDIIAEQPGHATIFPEKAVDTVGHEEIVDSIPLTAVAIEEEIIIGQVDDTTVQSIAQPESQILQNDTSVDSIAQPENQLIEEIVEQVDDTTVESIAQRENKLLKQVADATIVSIAQPEHDISDDTVMEQVDDSAIIQEEVIETIASHTYETSTEIVTEQIEDTMIEEVTEHLAQNYPSTTKGISQQILMEQIHDTMVVQEVLEPIVSNINDICEEIVMEQVDETMIEEEVIDNILQNETSEDEHASEKCSIDDSGVFENSLDAGSERSEMQSHEVSTNDELIKMGDDVGVESSTSNEVHSSDNQGDDCSDKYEDQPDKTQASKIVNSDSSSCLQRTPISVTNSFEGRETDVTNEDKLAENDPVKAMDERNSKNSILYEETLSQHQ